MAIFSCLCKSLQQIWWNFKQCVQTFFFIWQIVPETNERSIQNENSNVRLLYFMSFRLLLKGMYAYFQVNLQAKMAMHDPKWYPWNRYLINKSVYFGSNIPKCCQAVEMRKLLLYINFAWWVSVCLYPINVKTAEPVRARFCVGPHVAPGKVYEWSKFKKFDSIKIRFPLNFWKFW